MQSKFSMRTIAGLLILLVLSGCGGEAYIPGVVRNAPELTAVAQQPNTIGKDFVLIWEVYGTPTPAPTLNARQSAAATAFAQNRPAQNTGTTPGTGAAQAGNVPIGDLLPADPRRGELVFMGAGTCMSCHDTTSGTVIVGPSLKGVSEHAADHVPGMSIDEYLRQSILEPNAYVVEGFNPIMPQHFGTALTKQQIEDLIAYLKSL